MDEIYGRMAAMSTEGFKLSGALQQGGTVYGHNSGEPL